METKTNAETLNDLLNDFHSASRSRFPLRDNY